MPSTANPLSTSDYVVRIYDADPAREWARGDRHRSEFAVTLRALREHLEAPPARVLDCGGGPGRYAIELARLGHEVTLFDLSAGCLQLARQKAAEAGVTLAGYEQGTATDLRRFADASFDAVLLMGPLYHLLEEGERQAALVEARRVLRPGGLLCAAFITRYAAHRDAAAKYPTYPVYDSATYERILADGCLLPRPGERPGFVAYFAHPAEVAPLCWQAGFEVIKVMGAEGLVSAIEDCGVNSLTGAAWDYWADLNYRVASDPILFGAADHLLVIAAKPRWRAALRQIAARLAGEGLPYRVVGGAALALHGLPAPVKDLDIETDADGAYRFAELFAGQVVTPMALREGKSYRSHFGQFDFGGVAVDVMGDLQRREGGGWIPADALTEVVVDLEGAPVRASTLEEETLTYIRRGRLERAALCLPRCDRARLLALLRGELATQAL